MNTPLRKIYWFLTQQIGLDILKLGRAVVALPWYVTSWEKFRREYRGELRLLPCLHDRHEQSGAAATEYFAQDLYVAQQVFKRNPQNHGDIGSRIDGFVAHIAAFRPIIVMDIRPNSTRISNVEFVQADLMSPPSALIGSFDSLSCLHTLEHFGLGRYGDPIDAAGHVSGLRNMASLVAQDGTFYLSVPVGRERVEFNAHRIFDPRSIIALATESGLRVEDITFVAAKGAMTSWDRTDAQLAAVALAPYALSIFTFRKTEPGRVA